MTNECSMNEETVISERNPFVCRVSTADAPTFPSSEPLSRLGHPQRRPLDDFMIDLETHVPCAPFEVPLWL